MADTSRPKEWPRATPYTEHMEARMRIIAKVLAQRDDIRSLLPGLDSLLDDHLSPHVQVAQWEHFRRLLQVFRNSPDQTFEKCLDQLLPQQQERIQNFVKGAPPSDVCKGFRTGPSIGVRENARRMKGARKVHLSSHHPTGVKGLRNSEERWENGCNMLVMKLSGMFWTLIDKLKWTGRGDLTVYKDAPFQNWGLDIHFLPIYTCIPTTVGAIQRIVSPCRSFPTTSANTPEAHSWAPIFGRDKQILISLLPLEEVEIIPNHDALPFPERPPNELQTIELVPGKPRNQGNALVRVGVSCTNERFRRWSIAENKWTLPLNVIMVETTLGGSNGAICHGAGIQHSTLSDLVRKVEFVDCNGELQIVENPRLLKAAAGCFGLMGVITHLTLEVQPMTYALLQPQKVPLVRAVPPPDDMPEDQIPPALRIPLTPEEKAADIDAFESHCENDYYSEFFWFPYADDSWVNCWSDVQDPSGAIGYPSDEEIFLMFLSQFTLNVLQYTPALVTLIEVTNLQAAALTLFTHTAMLALPGWDKARKTPLPNALHFQRGIQNVRVLDVEVEIPLQPAQKDNLRHSKPALGDGQRPTNGIAGAGKTMRTKPDWNLVRRAWWDAVLVCYRHADTCPQWMPLEMRITAGSEIVMASQRGNDLGTCSIEVLTLEAAKDRWTPYAEEIVGLWTSYKDAEGRRLRTRPHWAKQWASLKLDGKPWVERLKSIDYKTEIEEFRGLLGEIGKGHGWTLEDLKRRFSNDFLDEFFFDVVE